MTELLWLNDYDTRTDEGQALIDARTAFLCETHVRNAYAGYDLAQARRLQERAKDGKAGFSANTGNRTAKHGWHCLRLLHQAGHLLATGQLMVDVSHLRDELFAAGRLAETNPEAFSTLFEKHMARLEETVSVLAAEPDTATINAVLIGIRVRHLT